MGKVILHPDGQVEVVVPNTPEEDARAEAGLIRLIEAMARADARCDYAAALAQATGRTPGSS